MSGKNTKVMIAAYESMAMPLMFFMSLFVAPPENFHNSAEVEVDIMRSEEDVSIVILDPSTGYRMNSADIYTNKGIIPPVHKEAVVLNASQLLGREFGEDPFQSVNFRRNAIARLMRGWNKNRAQNSPCDGAASVSGIADRDSDLVG